MALFSFHTRDHKKGQQRPSPLPPRLYVIGGKSAEHQEAVWALEVELQEPSEGSADLTAPDAKHEPHGQKGKHGRYQRHKPEQSGDAQLIVPAIKSTFFNLQQNHASDLCSTDTLPIHNPVIKISVPVSADRSTSSASEMLQGIEQSLRAASSSPGVEGDRLKHSLLSLQKQPHSSAGGMSLLPTTQQGFDVDKFVYFATSTLQYRYSHLQSSLDGGSDDERRAQNPVIPEQYISHEQIDAYRGAEGTVQKIDYAKFLKENAELRRQMEQGTRGNFVNWDNDPQLRVKHSDVEDKGESKQKSKGFGGFWVSYGPSSGDTDEGDSSRRPNPYGGLM